MLAFIKLFAAVLCISIGVSMIVLALFPVVVLKKRNLYYKYYEDIKADNYKKIYHRKLTSLGKFLLIFGICLLLLGAIWLMIII